MNDKKSTIENCFNALLNTTRNNARYPRLTLFSMIINILIIKIPKKKNEK